MKPIYLDYNATTPIAPQVAEAMMPYLTDYFGNPSSSHWYGIQTKTAIEKARTQVAQLINCSADEIIFTSGGTEANNMAIRGIATAKKIYGNHIITTDIEHPAVTEVCKYLQSKGFKVTYLPVDETGMIRPSDLEKAITPQTILISIMHANNEIGTIQPIKQICQIARKHSIIVHTDAAQSVGKIPVDVSEFGVDLLSIAGHKLYAPKGVGALYIRKGTPLDKLTFGANHERGMRPGTENVLEIVGLGKAAQIANENMDKNMLHMRQMRDKLYNGLMENLQDIKLNGHLNKGLPNTLSISFKGLRADRIIDEIGDQLAVSAGAACHSGDVKISKVLKAMDVPKEFALGTLRFSTGKMTTNNDIETAIKIITQGVKKLRTG